MTKDVGSQIKSGFKVAGALILGMAWLGLVFGGMAVAFTPSPHPPALGWVLLVIAALVLSFTMDRWVKAFPGIMACGVLGSIITLVDGHAVNNPKVVVSSLVAVGMILFFATATALSLTFVKHKLTVPDHIALFGVILCFFWSAAVPRLMLVALGIGFSCLVAAWAYDRLGRSINRRTGRTSVS